MLQKARSPLARIFHVSLLISFLIWSFNYILYRKPKTPDPLSFSLKQCEGAVALKCWTSVIESLLSSAAAALTVASELRLINHEKIGTILITLEKNLRAARENEDIRWKQLCDAARKEAKARRKLESCSLELSRAKKRMDAVENIDADENARRNKTSPAMNKALGNMFSILPGGEEAMAKMLSRNQRLAIAQANVNEAQAKEAKEIHAQTTAAANKSRIMTAYAAFATALDCSFVDEEVDGWVKVRDTLREVVELFLKYRSLRYNSLITAMDTVKRGQDLASSDIKRWTSKLRKRRAKHMDASGKVDREGSLNHPETSKFGFALCFRLEDARTVYALLNLIAGETSTNFLASEATRVGSKNRNAEIFNRTVRQSERGSNVHPLPEIATQIYRSASEPGSVSRQASTTRIVDRITSTTLIASENEDIDKQSVTRTPPQSQSTKGNETDLFLAHFWDDVSNEEARTSPAPNVIDSFSCAYWPKESEGHFSPLLHGRMFVTGDAFFFIGWGGKKIVAKWMDCASVKKDTTVSGLVDNAITITCLDENEKQTSYFFGSFAFRDRAFELVNRLITVAQSLKEINSKRRETPKEAKALDLPAVPADETLKKMEVLFSKKICNISIQDFYRICWSEGSKSDASPIYGPWLTSSGNYDVTVGKWETPEKGDEFVRDWCGEKYSETRVSTM